MGSSSSRRGIMTKHALLLIWVVLLGGSQFQAVPLRSHGGVIYGVDFLRILDPRERSTGVSTDVNLDLRNTTAEDSSANKTLASTMLPDELKRSSLQSQNDNLPSKNLMLSSRHLRKFDTLASSLSGTSSVSSSTNTESQNSQTLRQKLNAKRTQEMTPANHRKGFRKSATTDNNLSPTTAPTNTVTAKESITQDLSTTADTGFVIPSDDYDDYYYYYYSDDALPLFGSSSDTFGKVNGKITETSTPKLVDKPKDALLQTAEDQKSSRMNTRRRTPDPVKPLAQQTPKTETPSLLLTTTLPTISVSSKSTVPTTTTQSRRNAGKYRSSTPTTTSVPTTTQSRRTAGKYRSTTPTTTSVPTTTTQSRRTAGKYRSTTLTTTSRQDITSPVLRVTSPTTTMPVTTPRSVITPFPGRVTSTLVTPSVTATNKRTRQQPSAPVSTNNLASSLRTTTPVSVITTATKLPFRYQSATTSTIKTLPIPEKLLSTKISSISSTTERLPSTRARIRNENKQITTTEKPRVSTFKPNISLTESTKANATIKPPNLVSADKQPRVSQPRNAPKPSSHNQALNVKPKGRTNSTSRHFRYTTAMPRPDTNEETPTTEKASLLHNLLQKSLGSASSSSVVVEVRVESPLPEPRRMPDTKIPHSRQTLNQNDGKSTTLSPRTLQSVNLERQTTSFLLNDPLVVDLNTGPTTSNQRPTTSNQRPAAAPLNRHVSSQARSSSSRRTKAPTSVLTMTVTPSPEPQPQQESLVNTTVIKESQANQNLSNIHIETSKVEVSGSVKINTERPPKNEPNAHHQSQSELSANTNTTETPQNQTQVQENQYQIKRVSSSISRTEARTAEQGANTPIKEKSTQQSNTTIPLTAVTVLANGTILNETNALQNATQLRIKIPRTLHALAQQGVAPLGLTPFGQTPEGIAPFGNAPEGLTPHGLIPTGLNPQGLSPQGLGLQNGTDLKNGTGLTFVDATVAEGGADANNTVGYVIEGYNMSRFRLEEKTSDGFIIGEYGVVDHSTGDVNGVRYTADSSADPHLIYETLMKFLEL